MTELGTILWVSAVLLAGLFTVLWLASLWMRDAGIVDIFWGASFVLVSWAAFLTADGLEARRLLIVGLTTVWGVRLSIYLAWRNLGKEEDHRYAAMRERWGSRWWWWSYGQVFLLQAALAWVVSLPVQAGQVPERPGLGWMAAAGTVVWLAGLLFEGMGDLQLARFKADPANADGVLDTGLWRLTRHPNYFGDFLVWWGIWIVAAESGAWWTVIGPLLMTILLLRVSGVTMLERTIADRRPGYAEYVRRTSTFFPWRPEV
jgi:steroid 5-alpha reductase family enzyme